MYPATLIAVVGAKANHTTKLFGSGVHAADGIVLTATHVLEEIRMEYIPGYRRAVAQGLTPPSLAANLQLLPVNVAHGAPVQPLRSDPTICSSPETDQDCTVVRVCETAPAPTTWRVSRVDVGERITCYGLPGSSVSGAHLLLSPKQHIARVKRIGGKARWNLCPIVIDGNIEAGMSGGPAFDEDCRLIGICSYGATTEDESYLIPLSTFLALQVDLGTGLRSLHAHAREGRLGLVDGLDTVEVSCTGEDLVVTVQ